MASFLGVPIKVRDEVYGILYLTEKVGWTEFTHDDEALVGALAVAAGIAIENAKLHQRAQDVAVFEDRDRLARDLHDTVIQQLFAAGLSVQGMVGQAAAVGLGDRLSAVVSTLDDTIRQIRMTIYELGSAGIDRGIRANLLALVKECEAVVGFRIRVLFDGPVETGVPEPVIEHLLATVREAVTNIGRHAQASHAEVLLSVEDGYCRLRVIDNGCGIINPERTDGGLGLVNMRRRAEKFHGQLVIETPEAGGTSLTWQVPIDLERAL